MTADYPVDLRGRARRLVRDDLLPPRALPCRCGGNGTLREGHYPDWREIACDSCDRVEFGRDERAVILRWTTAHP